MGAARSLPAPLPAGPSPTFVPKHLLQYPGWQVFTPEWFANLRYLTDDEHDEIAAWPEDLYRRWQEQVEEYCRQGDEPALAQAFAFGTIRGLYLADADRAVERRGRERFSLRSWCPLCPHCGSYDHGTTACAPRLARIIVGEPGPEDTLDCWLPDEDEPAPAPALDPLDAWGAPL